MKLTPRRVTADEILSVLSSHQFKNRLETARRRVPRTDRQAYFEVARDIARAHHFGNLVYWKLTFDGHDGECEAVLDAHLSAIGSVQPANIILAVYLASSDVPRLSPCDYRGDLDDHGLFSRYVNYNSRPIVLVGSVDRSGRIDAVLLQKRTRKLLWQARGSSFFELDTEAPTSKEEARSISRHGLFNAVFARMQLASGRVRLDISPGDLRRFEYRPSFVLNPGRFEVV